MDSDPGLLADRSAPESRRVGGTGVPPHLSMYFPKKIAKKLCDENYGLVHADGCK